jgi:hydroxyethylthiazole kinase-like uncharacterized protein yjeF
VTLAGRVHVVPIGVPPRDPSAPPSASAASWGLIEGRDVAELLPRRPLDVHKGVNGRVLVLAGSRGKTGAAFLSALSALRAGAGLVTIATDAETQRALDQKVVELMTAALSAQDPLADAKELAAQQDAAVLGPGFGLSPDKRELALALARELELPCVLDADALTALGAEFHTLQAAAGPRVLTPHPGEAVRLLGWSSERIARDRYACALELATRSGHCVVLKGARSVVAAPDGRLRVCTSGSPVLATAGTGDVLSGVIATLCVSLSPFEAAWVGVELHARAGTLAAAGQDRGVLAGDVTRHLAQALEDCRTLPSS